MHGAALAEAREARVRGFASRRPVRRVFASRQPCVCLCPEANVKKECVCKTCRMPLSVQEIMRAKNCMCATAPGYNPRGLTPCRRLRQALRLVPRARAAGMRLRTKSTKKGFYNLKTLEQLAWCKGRVCTLQQSFLPPLPSPCNSYPTKEDGEKAISASQLLTHGRARRAGDKKGPVGHRLTCTHIHCRPFGQLPPRSQAELAPEAGSRQLAPEAASKCCACLSVRLRCCAL